MRYKRIYFSIILGMAFFYYSIFFINATCEESQVILRLSAETNAHAEIPTANNYNVLICYNEIFGEEGNGDRTCSVGNKIVGLSAETTAHAEIPSYDNYGVDVCYSGLLCENVSSKDECEEKGGKVVVSLSAETNAHLSNDSSDPNYPVKICCQKIEIGAFWANMNKQPIDSANIEETVLMVLKNGSYLQNPKFEIYKGEELIKTIENSSTIGNDRIAKWTIGDEVNKNDKVYFKVSDTKSNNLIIGEKDAQNSNPSVEILEPKEGEKFLVGEVINFTQKASDLDDDLELTWNFGDGKIEKKINCLSGNNCNTNHSYSEPGTKTVTLAAKEMTREQTAFDRVNIHIYKIGINIFPNISKPLEKENIEVEELQTIDINANTTYVSKCFEEKAKCEESSNSCYNVTGNTTEGEKTIWCYDFPKGEKLENYNLVFEWKFDPEMHYQSTLKGTWNENYSRVVEFKRLFFPGFHEIELKVDFVNESGNIIEGPSIKRSFFISTPGEQEISCSKNPFTNENGWLICDAGGCFFQTADPDNCKKDGKKCCPDDNMICKEESGNFKCKITTSNFCSDFTTKEECEKANKKFAYNEINAGITGGQKCGETISTTSGCFKRKECECGWKDDENKCIANASYFSFCDTTPDVQKMGECLISSSVQGDCEKGDKEILITQNFKWTGNPASRPADCPTTQKQFRIKCENLPRLPFFNFSNFIFSIILITFVYLIIKPNLNKN